MTVQSSRAYAGSRFNVQVFKVRSAVVPAVPKVPIVPIVQRVYLVRLGLNPGSKTDKDKELDPGRLIETSFLPAARIVP
jgi:hypothetical protein